MVNMRILLSKQGLVARCMTHVWSTNVRSFGACSTVLLQKKSADPIQQLFVDKIQEYVAKQQSSGGTFVDGTAEVEKAYKDEMDRVARMFQISGDPSKFPELKFEEPKLDPIFSHTLEEAK